MVFYYRYGKNENKEFLIIKNINNYKIWILYMIFLEFVLKLLLLFIFVYFFIWKYDYVKLIVYFIIVIVVISLMVFYKCIKKGK